MPRLRTQVKWSRYGLASLSPSRRATNLAYSVVQVAENASLVHGATHRQEEADRQSSPGARERLAQKRGAGPRRGGPDERKHLRGKVALALVGLPLAAESAPAGARRQEGRGEVEKESPADRADADDPRGHLVVVRVGVSCEGQGA